MQQQQQMLQRPQQPVGFVMPTQAPQMELASASIVAQMDGIADEAMPALAPPPGKTAASSSGASLINIGEGLTLEVQKDGDQKTFPKAGDKLSMHYTGTLTDGTKFDSSRDRGQPFEFTIGVGQVIQGWDQGVMKMSKGSRAVLHVPSDQGYGARGAGGVIPANADLDFDVELLKIVKPKA